MPGWAEAVQGEMVKLATPAAAITLHVTSPQAGVPCPLCHVQTLRVHSRYARTRAARPGGASAIRL